MKRGLVWTGVILAATVIDLGVHFATRLEPAGVLWIEAAIFLAVALVLYRLLRRDPASPGWRRAVQAMLVASFVLGALRSAIWASGQPVAVANGTILGLGVAAWVLWTWRKRSARRAIREPANPSDGSNNRSES
ncbi:MAG: hypothetical protein Q8W45_04865 [Candidatus Palauibacterales bacterium]|nr:hypothetical protein [Candidatus Palauibacterales bacterium]